MEPIWGWKAPGGPHVGPMNFAIWDVLQMNRIYGISRIEYELSEDIVDT